MDISHLVHKIETIVDAHVSMNDRRHIHAALHEILSWYGMHGRSPYRTHCLPKYHDVHHACSVTHVALELLDALPKNKMSLYSNDWIIVFLASLFHDVGYLIHRNDRADRQGAYYTKTHVVRGRDRLIRYLTERRLLRWCDAAEVLMYTQHVDGWKKHQHPRLHLLGCVVGTADYLAQMNDRCYLEKCRDHLFQEFQEAGIAGPTGLFTSPADMMKETPEFFQSVKHRLEHDFEGVHRYIDHNDGLSLRSAEKHIRYLEKLLLDGRLNEGLNRHPGH